VQRYASLIVEAYCNCTKSERMCAPLSEPNQKYRLFVGSRRVEGPNASLNLTDIDPTVKFVGNKTLGKSVKKKINTIGVKFTFSNEYQRTLCPF
jgi:hypothetical protein